MPRHPGGRPRKYTKKQVNQLLKKLDDYINNTEIPIIAEFAYLNDINRDVLYNYPEFFTLQKKAIAKKEAQLEKGSLTGKINTTQAIFSLKQLGWSDRIHSEHDVGEKTIEALKQLQNNLKKIHKEIMCERPAEPRQLNQRIETKQEKKIKK